ncbi:MAG: hypothetical protein J0H98_10740 [Solirubrobacterales bacterium]|nr:hypothetical protein [Solirubrobacterales bacterium]
MSSITKKVFGVAAVLLVLAGGVYGAFSATVSSTGNQFSTGAQAISADGGGDGVATHPVYFKTNAVPGDNGDNGEECVKITNIGTTNGASYKLYGSTTGTPTAALTSQLELTIREGSGDATDCSDFVAAGAPVYQGTLQDFQSGKTSFASGVDLGSLASAASKTYQFYVELPSDADPASIQNANAGNQTFTWEIQS